MRTSSGSTAPAPTAADGELASALRLSVMRLARRMRAERADTSLTLSQLAALATVERSGPLTPRELAAAERVQPPSMTRLVASLEAAGLVTRSAHPSDGRQVLLAVSRSGATLLREDRRRREAWLARELAGLEPEERAVLARAAALLDRLATS
ncbi:MAG: transcriptional regulator, MarR family [Frankiales bacterium]|nr:transcriptional regulator, MarR family [Frankiales bacterium]